MAGLDLMDTDKAHAETRSEWPTIDLFNCMVPTHAVNLRGNHFLDVICARQRSLSSMSSQ